MALWNHARQSAPEGLKRTDAEASEDRLRRVINENVKPGEADRWADVIAALIVHNASSACNDQSPSQWKVAAVAGVPKSQD